MFLLFFVLQAFGQKPVRSPRPSNPQEVKPTIFLYLDANTQFEQNFTKVASNERLKTIKFRIVDCVENKYYCEDEKITSFPTIKYQSESRILPYNWDFTYEDFYEFTIKMARSETHPIHDDKSLIDFNNHKSGFMLLFNQNLNGIEDFSYTNLFKRVSDKYKHTHVYFGIGFKPEIADLVNINVNSLPIILHTGVDEPYKFSLEGPFTESKIVEFVENHKCTMNLNLTYSDYLEALECFNGKVVGINFFSKSRYTVSINSGHVIPIAKEFRNSQD